MNPNPTTMLLAHLGLPVAAAAVEKNQPSCFRCDSKGGGLYKPHERKTDWYIGCDLNGQAHYACADCKDLLYNVSLLFFD